MIERSRQIGILKWDKPGVWKISSMPTGADAREGDLVITTGAGSVFPGGIRVGILTDVKTGNNSLGKDYFVTPFVNLQSVEEVFFIAVSQDYKEETTGKEQSKKKSK